MIFNEKVFLNKLLETIYTILAVTLSLEDYEFI